MSNDLFAQGRDVQMNSRKGGSFVKIPPDESVEIVPLTSLEGQLSPVNGQHEFWDINPVVIFPCLGRENECPGCKKGNVPKMKRYLPVLVKGDVEKKQSIFAYGPSIYKQLVTIEDTIIKHDGDPSGIEGKVIMITRSGSGMRTRYSVMQRPQNVDISEVKMENFVDRLGPTDPDEIWQRLEQKPEDEEDGWGSV